MSKSESQTTTDELPTVTETTYYDCQECDYRSPVSVSLPLCPECKDRISETVTY